MTLVIGYHSDKDRQESIEHNNDPFLVTYLCVNRC